MLFWLHQKAWDKIKEVNSSKIENHLKQDSIKKALLAISLLEGIIERRLYKVTFTMTPVEVPKFCSTTEDDMAEQNIKRILNDYRSDSLAQDKRNELEKLMSDSSGLPFGSFLIYIPGRKSQAKGIETGAFDENGKVNTLGKHSAVKDEVAILNNSYKNLWKVLVYVHPQYKDRCFELSVAVDAMLGKLFPGIKCKDLAISISAACSFLYIPPEYRDAAKVYIGLNIQEPLNWANFMNAINTTTGTLGSEEHAYRTKILENLSLDQIKNSFKKSNSLESMINAELEKPADSDSYSGMAEKEKIKTAISIIADKVKNGKLL